MPGVSSDPEEERELQLPGRRANGLEKQAIKDNPRLWLIFLILLPLVLNSLRHPDNDFSVLMAAVRNWEAGTTRLYDASTIYYNVTPWAVIVYLPLSYLPDPFGSIIFTTLSLGLLIWATWRLSRPVSWVVLALSLTTLYTGMLMLQSQWDALVLGALTFGWLGVQQKKPWWVGLALVGMTTKYTYMIITLILLLYAIRRWPLKDLGRVALLPMLTLPLSFWIAGWDWPIRYSRLLRVTLDYFDKIEVNTLFSTATYPTSYWRLAPPLGPILIITLALIAIYLIFRLIVSETSLRLLNLTLALNLVAAPYFSFHHLIYLAPAQAQLLKRHRWWGMVLFGAAILDLLLLLSGVGLIIFPLAALAVLIITTILDLREEAVDAQQPEPG